MFKSISKLLSSSKVLSRIAKSYSNNYKIKTLLQQKLPGYLIDDCKIIFMHPDIIAIKANNAGVASKLKQLIPSISKDITKCGISHKEIKISVPRNIKK